MDEFQVIEEIFAPLAPAGAPAFGLSDDAAVYQPGAGRAMVITKDVMAAGVHFPADEDAGLVARKLLRVNLSDLAAMGAAPHGYLLGLALGSDTGSDTRIEWLRAFAAGLAQDQKTFAVALWGGDTVSRAGAGVGGLVLSLTAIGSVPGGLDSGEAGCLRRNGAKPGDLIFVSGSIGDGALGLKCVQGDLPANEFLMARYRLPEPRIGLGQALGGETLPGLATSCIDVSDGLLADLGHLAAASGCGAEIERSSVPLSDAARNMLITDADLWPAILAGGDDDELLFTAPGEKRGAVMAAGKESGTPVTVIGRMTSAGAGVLLLDEKGNPVKVDGAGFQHHIG